MLGLGLGITKTAGLRSLAQKLLSILRGRATYYENGAASKEEIQTISDYELLDKATILLTPTATSDARVHSVKTYTGEELVTNGTYNTDLSGWTNTSTHWQWSSGSAYHPLTTSLFPLKQDITNNVGAVLRITFDLTYVQGTAQCFYKNEANSDVSTTFTSSGSYTIITEPVKANTEINFGRAFGHNTEFYIDNISVVDVSSDFDFDRASSATRINSSGLVQDMQSITDPELVLNGDFEELGDDEVTNGTFDTDSNWSATNGATITGGVLNIDYNLGNGSTTQSNVFTIGKTYKIQLNVDDSSTGTARIDNGVPATLLSNGLNTFYIVATGTTLEIRNHVDFVGSIDNVSVQQVDPNDRWSLGTGWSIENGKANATNAGFTRLETPSGLNAILTVGNTYKCTFDVVDEDGGEIYVEKNVNDAILTGVNSVGSYSVIFVAADDQLRFQSRNNSSISIDNVSVKDITFSTDVDLARINYDSNGENGHWLLEPTSTNLVPYSEDFSDSSWNLDFAASFITRTPNAATSPSGKNNATKLIGNDTSGDPNNSYIGASTSASAPYTASVFAKKAEYDYLLMSVGTYAGGYWGSFNLSNGTVDTQPTQANTSASIESYGNGWYRCSLTTTTASGGEFCLITPSVDGTLLTDYTSTTNGVYVWGAQLEELSYATSYIPTLTGSTVTRATETLTGSGNSTLINSTEGVLYAEIAMLSENDKADGSQIFLSSGSSNSRIGIFTDNNGDYRVQIKDNDETVKNRNVTILDQSDSSVDTAAFNKIAILYKSGQNRIFVNGSRIADTNFDSYTFDYTVESGSSSSLKRVGFDNGNGTDNYFRGKVKALAVFDEVLEDDELELLTGVTNYSSFGALAAAEGYTII